MTGLGLRERPAARPTDPSRNGDPGRATPPPAAERRLLGRPASDLVDLGLFAALAAFGTAQWARLVVAPPVDRLLLALGIVLASAAVLIALGARVRPGRRRAALAIACSSVATAAAMVAVGLEARLLAPGNWGELFDDLSRGLAGIEDSDLPYDGGDPWVRLTILLFVPALLGLAAALAFWPRRHRGAIGRIASLAVLVALYGVAVTLDSPGGELLWGVALLVLCIAWLWMPRTDPRGAALAIATAGVAGALALPVATVLDGDRPWWNYESWDWFARDSEVRFDWNHSYGPYEWPTEGTTLFEADTTRPLYWKASVLDRFDGFTWQRAESDDALAVTERSARRETPGAGLPEVHPDWRVQATLRMRALAGGVVVGAGLPQAAQGLEGVRPSADGTLHATGDGPRSGDTYSLLTYAPQPTAAELRGAPPRYPRRRFWRTTLVGLPATVVPPDPGASGAAEEAGLNGGFAPARGRAMALWGERPDAALRDELRASPYAATYGLARRLVADAGTPYAAVRAIERHLRSGYDYSQSVPDHTYPLSAFLFEDRAGYCQQFAGTMALMLRMVGIPSRVVSGFAPGSLDSERGVYEVRDTDAHSWVEVYFRGIGWVTFDPTPAAAPAASRTFNSELGPDAALFRGRGAALAEQGEGRGRALEQALEGGVLEPGGGGRGPWPVIAIGILALAAVATIALASLAARRRRALDAGRLAAAQAGELRAALSRLGWTLPDKPTLLAIERRFRRTLPAVSAYASALRAHLYGPDSPPPPGSSARRATRRALAAGGIGARLRGLLAIPPGGPGEGELRHGR